jgi:hypothetical protein
MNTRIINKHKCTSMGKYIEEKKKKAYTKQTNGKEGSVLNL